MDAEGGSGSLPVILGTVSLLLTVVLVAPLAMCCCFKRRRSGETERLLDEGNTGRSYSGAPTSNIQSVDNRKWAQTEPVSSKEVAITGPKSSRQSKSSTGQKKEHKTKVTKDHHSPHVEAPPTQVLPSNEESKIGITGKQSASNVEKVMFVNEAGQSNVKVSISEEEERPSSPQLDQHQVYSLKDFQPFESKTYDGIYNEVQEWVKPLVTNRKLQSAYLSYVTPPHTAEKLQKLFPFLQEYGKALRAHKQTPAVTYAPMETVISALDPEWGIQTDEVASMIVVSEALMNFPQHIVKKAIVLSSEKRTTLVDFIRSTPYGVDQHVYTDEGPFRDPELNPFMTRMGFSLPPHTDNLVLELEDEENEDRLTAGLILMLATQPH